MSRADKHARHGPNDLSNPICTDLQLRLRTVSNEMYGNEALGGQEMTTLEVIIRCLQSALGHVEPGHWTQQIVPA